MVRDQQLRRLMKLNQKYRKLSLAASLFLLPPDKQFSYFRGKEYSIKDFADVLYDGLRCGILHEACFPHFCVVFPNTATLMELCDKSFAIFIDDGSDCPSVAVNPNLLLEELIAYFDKYIAYLKDTSNQGLRDKFKNKIWYSFGIRIGKESRNEIQQKRSM